MYKNNAYLNNHNSDHISTRSKHLIEVIDQGTTFHPFNQFNFTQSTTHTRNTIAIQLYVFLFFYFILNNPNRVFFSPKIKITLNR